ncbi:MAG: two-component regulator propeller domain-containing protein [Bacteroidota bacterium]
MLLVQYKQSISSVTIKRIIWILLFSVLVFSTQAQKIPFKNYTIQNGLPQNTVNGICQDSEGYIWFATQVGAARFDGYEFEYFTISNGLPNNFVNCLLAARNGDVWLGTEGGLARFDGTLFRIFDEAHGLVSNRVDRLEEDHKGNIWVATAYGLSVVTPDTIISYTKENALSDNSIKDIFVDSRGRVHVATHPLFGLTIFDDPFTYKEELGFDNVISDIIETSEGQLWYATQGSGILVRDGEGDEWLGFSDGLTDEIVLSMTVDHMGRVWCGTYTEGLFVYENGHFSMHACQGAYKPLAREIYEDGLHRIWIVDYQEGVWLLDKEKLRNLTIKNNLVNDLVTDILEDRYGSIWLGTISGVSKYGRVIFEVTDSDIVLPENNVSSVFLDSRERLWFSPYGYLMYIYRDQVYMMDEERNGYISGRVTLSFAEDFHKNIFVGTDVGLYHFNGRALTQMEYWKDAGLLEFYSLYYAEDRKLWCGTDSGLYIMDGSTLKVHHGQRTLLDLQVNAIDQVGNLVYCATRGGVSVFNLDGQHLVNYTTSDSLSSNKCYDITHDSHGNVWVGTDRGLSKITGYPEPAIIKLGAGKGLPSNAIYFLEINDSTSLWLGTEKGLFRYNTESEKIDYYGIEDGFYPLETNQGAVTRGAQGDLWMGTVSGLVHYLSSYDKKDTVPPDLILFPPVVDGQKYKANEDAKELNPAFPFNRNSLEFSFTGIHTTIPEQNRFACFLEGYEDSWSAPGIDRSVSYKKLPNGNYVFRVKAFNLDGVASEQEESFAFTIKPPVWKTFWFILLEVLAGLSLIYGTIKYRERQLIREKRVLESKVKERTREIEVQKEEIEAQRDEIAGQNKEITDSIHYAKHIQHAVLPGKISLDKTLPEHFILFKPRDIVSGDFYWVEQKQDRIIVCAADCTGHGVPGAFMSLLGLTFLNEIVNKDEILKASEILNRLRRYIINSMSHKDTQARDGMDLSLVVIDKQINIMEYAGAYNPLLLVRGGEMIEFKADKMPIGKHEGDEYSFTNHKIQIQDGDMIYLFSDGFADQFGGESGGKYKAKPFKRFLQQISIESMERQEEQLEAELKSWMRNYEQVDDILVMGIRYSQLK